MIEKRLLLWSKNAPYSLGESSQDLPFMDVYVPEDRKATGSSMLIFPGGSYTFLSEKSGSAYGEWLATAGITAFVVNFRLGVNGYRNQAILADAQRAITLVFSRADDWGVDPSRIGVVGTSAGGHLATLLLTHAGFDNIKNCPTDELDFNVIPNLGVLCYPVISMKDPIAHLESRNNLLGEFENNTYLQEMFSTNLHVTEKTPPCFIWHTLEDEEVPEEHSRLFAEALRLHSVPYELHLYEKGAHRLGLARNEGLFWTSDCIRWLRSHGF